MKSGITGTVPLGEARSLFRSGALRYSLRLNVDDGSESDDPGPSGMGGWSLDGESSSDSSYEALPCPL